MSSRKVRWVVTVPVVVIAATIGSLAIAVAQPPPVNVDFSPLNAHRPVPGRIFEGLSIINLTSLNGTPRRFTSVRCDAEIDGKRLRARKLVYGAPSHGGRVQVIVCGWLIPADAGGKTLRFWKNHSPISDQRRAVVQLYGEVDRSAEYTWRVASP